MTELPPSWVRSAENDSIQVRGWNSDALDRLKTVVREFGGPKSVSTLAGIPLTTLHSALRGDSDPRSSMLAAIAEVTGQSIDWIMFGKGPVSAQGETRHTAAPDPAGDLVSVPFFNVRASAGPGSVPVGEQPLLEIDVDRRAMRFLGVSSANAAVLTIHGDSAEPNLSEGDVILIDRSLSELRDGGMYVIGIDDDVVVKRVERQIDRSVLLKSDNPAYTPQRVTPADLANIRVLGRVRWALRAVS